MPSSSGAIMPPREEMRISSTVHVYKGVTCSPIDLLAG